MDIGPGRFTIFCPFQHSKRIAGMIDNLNFF